MRNLLTKFRVTFVALTAVSAGCTNDDKPSRYEFQDRIEATLKDPDSAKFTEAEVWKHRDGTHAFCAKLNAKNSFGAYTGIRGVIVDRHGLIQHEPAPGDALAAANWRVLWLDECTPL